MLEMRHSFSKIERQRDANRILEAAIVNAGWGLIVANKGAESEAANQSL